MNKWIASALVIFGTLPALAATDTNHYGHYTVRAKKEVPTLRLTLVPQDALTQGKPVTVFAKLTRLTDQSLVTDKDLVLAHTQKFHLLVIDPSLTDYHHIHPQPTDTPGLYSFTFTPRTGSGYRAWADVTLAEGNKQEFVKGDLGEPRNGIINKAESYEATAGGYRFTLSFESPLTSKEAAMGKIKVADSKGNPVDTLEPVMGAFAHIVGFYDDFRTVSHSHPMGKEPASEEDRGGPELSFHLEPKQAGVIRLYAQFKIAGKEIFVPFTVKAP